MIYTKGFYNEEENYDFLSTLTIKNKNLNALEYLHGNCQDFSIALYEEFGYPTVLWTEYDDSIENMVLIHAFNVIKQDNDIFYVDIRGITNDLNTLTSGFDYSEDISVDMKNISHTLNTLKKLGIKVGNINIPKKIIQSYKEHYII